MIYKYYTCDLIATGGGVISHGSFVKKFSILKSPVACHAEMIQALESNIACYNYKIVNFRRVK